MIDGLNNTEVLNQIIKKYNQLFNVDKKTNCKYSCT